MKSEAKTDLDVRLIRNFMDIIILKRLGANRLTSGYDLIKYFHQKFHMLVSSGSIYSTLYSLERQGLIEGNSDGRKRIFRISAQGKEFLNRICLGSQRSHFIFSSILSNPDA